jgi:hypothetical protein
VISFGPYSHLAVTGILTQRAADHLTRLRDPCNALRQPSPGQHRRGPVHHLGRADSSGLLTPLSDGPWLPNGGMPSGARPVLVLGGLRRRCFDKHAITGAESRSSQRRLQAPW